MWDLGGKMEYKIRNYVLMSVLLPETTNPCVLERALERGFLLRSG